MRKLMLREKVMLVVLGLILICALYYLLLYMPISDAIIEANASTEEINNQIVTADARLTKKQRMEEELAQIFAAQKDPVQLPEYDNVHAVMQELYEVLATASSYSLSFNPVAPEANIVRRTVFIQYACGSYTTAREIIKQLHDGDYRCQISDLTLTDSMDKDGVQSVNVTMSLTYYEYMTKG